MQLALFVKLAHLAKRVDLRRRREAGDLCVPRLRPRTGGRDARRSETSRRAHRRAAVVVAFAAGTARLPESAVRPRVCGGRHSARRGRVAAAAQRTARNGRGAAVAHAGPFFRKSGCSSTRLRAASQNWWPIGTRVIDPDTKQPRPLRFGDVAVLARTKQHVEDIAHALKAARVPMKMSLAGLFKVPEVCLARACLRRSGRSRRHAGDGRDRCVCRLRCAGVVAG